MCFYIKNIYNKHVRLIFFIYSVHYFLQLFVCFVRSRCFSISPCPMIISHLCVCVSNFLKSARDRGAPAAIADLFKAACRLPLFSRSIDQASSHVQLSGRRTGRRDYNNLRGNYASVYAPDPTRGSTCDIYDAI